MFSTKLFHMTMLDPTFLPEIPNLSRVNLLIQQSIAPVFLLAGIGALLNVLSSRIGRIHDRRMAIVHDEQLMDDAVHHEAQLLKRRAKLANLAMQSLLFAELMICCLIAIHFIGGLMGVDAALWVALSFLSSMIGLIVGVLFFLREAHLALSLTELGHIRLKRHLDQHALKEAQDEPSND